VSPGATVTFQPVNEVLDAKAQRKARQAFYTPMEVGEAMVREAGPALPSMRYLEPSAGDGRLVHLLRLAGAEQIDVCETDAAARERLLAAGEAHLVGEDFLSYRPAVLYDRIVMNPPFSRNTYVRHIEHAWSLLAPGGRIVTLGPNGLGDLLTRCALELPGCISATWEMIEKNAFREYGTGIEVTFATLDRELRGSEPEVCGFSNHSTANAVFTIEHRQELLEQASEITDPEEMREVVAPVIGKTGGSCYGVDWDEVIEHLQGRLQEEAAEAASTTSGISANQPAATGILTWVFGAVADREGLAAYTHLVRAPGDPQRTPRPKGGHQDRAPHRTLAKRPAAELEELLLEGLADGEPRTFNRLGVEIFDLTADVLFTTPVNAALWRLVDRGEIEHTLEAPVLFRRRRPALVTDDAGQGLLFEAFGA